MLIPTNMITKDLTAGIARAIENMGEGMELTATLTANIPGKARLTWSNGQQWWSAPAQIKVSKGQEVRFGRVPATNQPGWRINGRPIPEGTHAFTYTLKMEVKSASVGPQSSPIENFVLDADAPDEIVDLDTLIDLETVTGEPIKVSDEWTARALAAESHALAARDFAEAAAAPGDTQVSTFIDTPGSRTAVALNANFVGKKTHTYDVRDYGAVPGIDCLAAFEAAIADMPPGAVLWVEPLPAGQSYLLSDTLIIDKTITIQGSVNRVKASEGGGIFGSVIRPLDASAQSGMRALLRVTATYVHVNSIGLIGRGAASGSTGLLFSGGPGGGWNPEDGLLGGDTASHMSTATGVLSTGFDTGIDFGSDSDHIFLDKCVATDNRDGIRISGGNRFDFLIKESSIEGNTRASVYMPSDSNVENVTILRTHLGYGQYGILQESPGATAWGISCMTLIDSPIEQVSEQFIRAYYCGYITIQGGYWTWTLGTTSTKAPIHLYALSSGPLRFSAKLEPSYPNPNSPQFLQIDGYTTHPIYIDSQLNGFAQKWVNYGASVNTDRVFIQGMPIAGQAKGAMGVHVDQSAADKVIASVTPVTHGLFATQIHLRVTATATVTLKFFYNNGAGPITKTILNAVSLAPGDYSYTDFAYCYTYNAVQVSARSSITDGSVRASVVIEPKRGS